MIYKISQNRIKMITNITFSFKLITFILASLVFVLSVQIEDDNGVYFVDNENYDDFIKENDYALMFFYMWPCHLCKQIIPELKKTSELLNQLEPPVKIASVNCTESDQIRRRLNIDKLSMRFIHKGNPMNYTGGRTSSEIVAWVKRMMGPSIGMVDTVIEIEELRKFVRAMIVFFGDNDQLFSQFSNSAKENTNLVFVQCKSHECLNYYNVNDGNVILFKKYDEGRIDLKVPDYNSEELNDFIKESSKPSVMNFDFDTARHIFEEKIPGIFLYLSKSGDETSQYMKTFQEIASKVKNKLQPVVTDIIDIAETKLAEMMGVKLQDLPMIMIHDTRQHVKSYKMNNEITTSNILEFVEAWENNSLERNIKTKEVPMNQTDHSYILVGSNLEKFVNNVNQDVLVLFYAPWCTHSKELMPIYESIAKKFQNNTNLLIAKFDAHYNEPSIIQLQYYPTIVLWRSDNKRDYIEFKEERNEENLIKFIQTYSTVSFNNDCSQPVKE